MSKSDSKEDSKSKKSSTETIKKKISKKTDKVSGSNKSKNSKNKSTKGDESLVDEILETKEAPTLDNQDKVENSSDDNQLIENKDTKSEDEIIHEAQSLTEIKDEKQVSLDDFDWSEYEEGVQHYSDSEYKKLEIMYDETLSVLDETKIIEGKIVAQSDRDFIIDIGAKSEGVISINEFRYNPEYKLGDTVEVIIDKKENKTGQIINTVSLK